MKQTLKYIYNVLSENLKFAESKHGILIALNSALAVFVSGYLTHELFVVKFASCLIIVFVMFSLFFNFMALLSRKIRYQKNIKYREADLNLIYQILAMKNIWKKLKKRITFPKIMFLTVLIMTLASKL